MNVISKLFGLKSATDFATVLPELVTDLAYARERQAKLRARMRSAPFETGADEVKRLRQEIREIDEEIETLTGLVEETEKRQQAAASAEEDGEILAQLSEARSAVNKLRADFKAFDEHAAATREILGRVDSVIALGRKANARAGITESYFTGRPPRFHDERARIPHINTGHLRTGLDGLLNNGVLAWFDALEASGNL